MFRRARSFIACLLLLVFPLKGAFAASMVACERTQEQIAVAPEWIPHMHDAGRANVGTGHHFAAADASPAEETDDGRRDVYGLSECGSCAACCIGGVFITAAVPTTPPCRGAGADFPAVDFQFSGHVPAALERPPQPPLA